tara:strand:- start:36159 stop:36587 length:429 start_codon:yes stop_codon:yes gene_type:complete
MSDLDKLFEHVPEGTTELRENANKQLQSVCNHNAMQQPEITRLRVELAKANERVKELESYNVKLTNESHEYQQRVYKLERSLEERTRYINTLADSVQRDINRVWILDGFVEQVSKVDCESFTEVFLIKDTASRLLRKEQDNG